jgi:hypothetical protein
MPALSSARQKYLNERTESLQRCERSTGLEFIMTFDQLAHRLAPIGEVASIGKQQYGEL